jgi:hypothetical protein
MNLNSLIQTLSMATTADRTHAEQQLAQWESLSGYFPALLDIFGDASLDPKIRTLAIICCKNGIEKYWRKSTRNRYFYI